MKDTRKYERMIWEKEAVAGKRNGERERESSSALPLPSFLPFYFRVRAFSISLTRPSRSLEQARAGITLSSSTQGVNTTLFCAVTQDRVQSVDLRGLFTLGTCLSSGPLYRQNLERFNQKVRQQQLSFSTDRVCY